MSSRDGFLYYLCGGKHAVKMLVSIASLRWAGHEQPIHISVGDPEAEDYAYRLRDDERLGKITIDRVDIETAGEAKRGKGRQHCAKSAMGSWTPFRRTIFLDADTLVTGNLNKIWPTEEQVVLTNFAQWKTTGGKLRSRLAKYKEALPREFAMMTGSAYPAINTGVMAWDYRAVNFHKKWSEVCLNHLVGGKPVFMGDEIVANLIFADYCHRILDDWWNFSPIYSVESRGGKFDAGRVKVWHFHGDKHCKKGLCLDTWFPFYLRAEEENLAKIQDWTPARDKSLKKAMQEAGMLS